jgi:hypothetical protein
MATITIDGTEFEVYADIDDADTYMKGAFHGQTWLELDEALKAQALVTATRILDRQEWRGEKADPEQYLQWPRSGVSIGGEPLSDDTFPVGIRYGTIELALILTQGTDVQNEQNTAQKIQSLRAGSVALSFFREAEGEPLRFPLIVHELISKYLLSGAVVLTGIATGVDGKTTTGEDFGFSRGF